MIRKLSRRNILILIGLMIRINHDNYLKSIGLKKYSHLRKSMLSISSFIKTFGQWSFSLELIRYLVVTGYSYEGT